MAEKAIVVALAQMDVVAGRPERNFARMESMVDEARRRGADLVVFPEMAVCGRFLADRWADDAFVAHLSSFGERIRALSRGIGIVFGNVGVGEGGGRRSMAYFAQDGVWVPRVGGLPAGRAAKHGRPDGPMPDEERHFAPADELGAGPGESRFAPFRFDLGGEECRIGLEVGGGRLAREALAGFGDAGCDLVVQIAASPWAWNAQAAPPSADAAPVAGGCPPLVRVNAVGMQNTGKNVLAFDGGSAAYAPDGGKAACRDDFEEELAIVKVSLADGSLLAVTEPARPAGYADGYEKALDAIVSALRRFDGQVFPFGPKWVIGLSGGIDSSVTAALLAMALNGPERIVGYNLATRYNSDATKANAYGLAQALGIRLANGSIEELVRATGNVLAGYGYPAGTVSGLAQENIQARLRGHLLSTFAAIEGGVVMNNGNKVEVALGYATLYGDAIGAICPIGDITKVQLFEIARRINRRLGAEAVPGNLIPEETPDGYAWETMPSAELKDAQRDPMKWFYHDWLVSRMLDAPGFAVEDVMASYLEDRLLSSEVGKWIRFYGLEDPAAFIEDLEWVTGQIGKSVFKRLQLPPAITITRGPVSFDRREAQVAFEPADSYRDLRRRILEMPSR